MNEKQFIEADGWIKSKDKKGRDCHSIIFSADDTAEIIDDGLGECLLYSANDTRKCLEGKYSSVNEAKEATKSWT